MLGALQVWAPDLYCVSFKLETDSKLLISKAQGAISKYGMHCVVANLLQTRYEQVTLVPNDGATVVVNRPEVEGGLVEHRFVPLICGMHMAYYRPGQ